MTNTRRAGIGGGLRGLLAAMVATTVVASPSGAQEARAPSLGVAVANASTPVLCAEEDNVTLTFTSDKVRRFRIEAVHPAYLAALDKDSSDADWTACDFGPKVEAAAEVDGKTASKPDKPVLPERITLHETVERWLIGLRFPNFWRADEATVRVGDKVVRGIHLLQLWRVRPNGGEEVVVLYPQDGYWRLRPIAPKGRDLTAYGSSVLIGPVEDKGRPVVRLKEVAYVSDDESDGFDLTFTAGGGAEVRLAEVSEQRLALEVSFDKAMAGVPFAALRSMYVTAYNNDVERVAIRAPEGKGWTEAGIMAFKGGAAAELWAGRRAISRHNTSAPDMIFKRFRE